jgi:hypothetical protein
MIILQLDQLLQFLQCTHLDLTYAFPRDAEFISKVVSSSRLVGKQPLLEYVTLTLVASGKSVPQYPVPPIRLLVFRQMALLVCGIVDEPVLELARMALHPDGRSRPEAKS